LCSSFISAGAIVGVLFHGRLMDRWSAYLVIGAGSLIAMVLLATLILVPSTPLLMFGFCFLVGAATLGSILANFAFANLMFPPSARMGMSAVVTWLGRLAGLVAPIGAGVILAAGGTAITLYLIASGFLLAAALSMLIPGLIRLRDSSTSRGGRDNVVRREDAKGGWREG
jgi:AAHS family 4-hydroxybenzoate transporter-like MFS transporter